MTQTTLINDIYGVVGSKGEITDLNVDGKNIGFVRTTTSPGGGVELSAGGVTLGAPVVAVTGPGGEITDLNVDGENLNLVRAVASPGGEIGITNIQSLTQAQYDALVTTDAATLYVIVEDEQPPVVEE